MGNTLKVLCVGDVVGSVGCEYLKKHLPTIKKEYEIDICIANGENSAQGNGITPFSAEQLFSSGVDFITTGNHAFKRNEICEYLEDSVSVIRPINFNDDIYGKGYGIVDKGSFRIGVINALGTVYLQPLNNPFDCIDKAIEELKKEVKIIILDFHAEATAEKRAIGFYLDGKVSVVFGTHTHVQTADEQILENGTGYITDIGMTGPIQSVLGITPSIAIEKIKTNFPVRFENPNTACSIEGCMFTIEKATGKTVAVERLRYEKV